MQGNCTMDRSSLQLAFISIHPRSHISTKQLLNMNKIFLAGLISHCVNIIVISTAWVGSIPFSLAFLASPIAALVCARIGCRWTVVIGGLMCGLGLVISSFSSSLLMMYFTYSSLFGLGTAVLHIPSLLIVQRYFHKRRSFATGIF